MGQTILHWQQWCLAKDQTWGKKVKYPLITSLRLCAQHLARNMRYLRSSAGWHPLPQPEWVVPNTLYSHNSQRISASELPLQLRQEHHQTNSTASCYSQLVTAPLSWPQPKSALQPDTNDLQECYQNKNHLWAGSSGGSRRMSEAGGTRCCQWPYRMVLAAASCRWSSHKLSQPFPSASCTRSCGTAQNRGLKQTSCI